MQFILCRTQNFSLTTPFICLSIYLSIDLLLYQSIYYSYLSINLCVSGSSVYWSSSTRLWVYTEGSVRVPTDLSHHVDMFFMKEIFDKLRFCHNSLNCICNLKRYLFLILIKKNSFWFNLWIWMFLFFFDEFFAILIINIHLFIICTYISLD